MKPLVFDSNKVKRLPSATTLDTNASATGAASLNVPHGTAPASPLDGDVWTTTAGIFVRINGATIGPLSTGTGGGTTKVSATVATAQTTSSTSYTDLATTGPSVTLTTGTTAIVTISCSTYRPSGVAGSTSFMSVAVSGATTIAAIDANAIIDTVKLVNANAQVSRTYKITGLTPGSNTFTAKYKQDSAVTHTYTNRDITVEAL